MLFLILVKSRLADVSAQLDTEEPGSQTTAETNSVSDDHGAAEAEELPSEKSEGEQDLSAMEVE